MQRMNNPGVIIFFDEARRRELIVEETILGQRSFSDALSVPDWDLRRLHVALLAFSDSTLDYLQKGRTNLLEVHYANRNIYINWH